MTTPTWPPFSSPGCHYHLLFLFVMYIWKIPQEYTVSICFLMWAYTVNLFLFRWKVSEIFFILGWKEVSI